MRILFRLIVFGLLLTTRFLVSDAAAQEPIIRAKIEEAGTIVPGQQVHLVLNVLAPGFFTSPPQFPLFALPHALVTLPDERSQNVTDTINGIQFSGIQKRYSIIPQVRMEIASTQQRRAHRCPSASALPNRMDSLNLLPGLWN
jgi:hypothetical protein